MKSMTKARNARAVLSVALAVVLAACGARDNLAPPTASHPSAAGTAALTGIGPRQKVAVLTALNVDGADVMFMQENRLSSDSSLVLTELSRVGEHTGVMMLLRMRASGWVVAREDLTPLPPASLRGRGFSTQVSIEVGGLQAFGVFADPAVTTVELLDSEAMVVASESIQGGSLMVVTAAHPGQVRFLGPGGLITATSVLLPPGADRMARPIDNEFQGTRAAVEAFLSAAARGDATASDFVYPPAERYIGIQPLTDLLRRTPSIDSIEGSGSALHVTMSGSEEVASIQVYFVAYRTSVGVVGYDYRIQE